MRIPSISIFIALILSISSLPVVQGCATIFKGTSEHIDLTSQPDGAEVYINGFLRGTTPLKLKLESKKTYNIEFKLEGHKTYNYSLTNHVGTGWVILDILAGVLPVVIDAATGAWYSLDEESFNAMLKKE